MELSAARRFVLLLATLLLCLHHSQQQSNSTTEQSNSDDDDGDIVLVQLRHGSYLQGTKLASFKEKRNFFAFRGIPYAEAPVGKLRFKPPIAKAQWHEADEFGVFDATSDGSDCPQYDFLLGEFIGDENCLFLNVYTRNLPDEDEDDEYDDDESLLPVMVWIHGGGFVFGTGSSSFYGPDYLMDQRIVLVTLNYRLGVLGFLSTGDDASPGNYGMLDQVMALEWVRDNIAQFGGDPSRVTIFGQSAGGASVGYHLLSPLSSGLFHGAIAMSGSPLCLWAHDRNISFWAHKLATDAGCPTANSRLLIECLRGKTPKKLYDISNSYSMLLGMFPYIYTPTVDKHFLLDDPKTVFTSGDIPNKVPFISGMTKREELAALGAFKSTFPNESITSKKFVSKIMEYMVDTLGDAIQASDLIWKHYFAGLDPSDQSRANDVLVDAMSHGNVDMCHYETVHFMAKAGVPTYAYSFDYSSSSFTFSALIGLTDKHDAAHADDVFMLFSPPANLPGVNTTPDETDRNVISQMITLWTNFAKRGNPTPGKQEITFPVEWLPTSPNPIRALHIDETPSTSAYDLDSNPIFRLWTERVPEAIRERNHQQQQQVKREPTDASRGKEEL